MNVQIPNNYKVQEVTAPASKSYAQRAILAATLSQQWSEIKNIGESDDVKHILDIAKQLGAEIEAFEDGVKIKGSLSPISNNLNCGESGLGTRMTIPIAAALGGGFTISGKGSLMNRPMDIFEEIFPAMGVEIKSNEGKLPIEIKGKLKGTKIEAEGSQSSQYFSGLLMALPLADGESWIKIHNITSGAYLDMTLDVLSMFGIMVPTQDNVFYIKGNQKYQPAEFRVEGDWSGAAFWVVYGAIANTILIKDVNMFSSQADLDIVAILELAGGKFDWLDEGLSVSPVELSPFEVDATNCPDLFPALVVLAASINGTSKIQGVNRLKHKESDRGVVLQQEFGKLGLVIEIEEDLMLIHGTGKLNSGTIDSHNDHRIAMAGAIASTLTSEGIEVTNAEAVSKSYPGFWDLIT